MSTNVSYEMNEFFKKIIIKEGCNFNIALVTNYHSVLPHINRLNVLLLHDLA